MQAKKRNQPAAGPQVMLEFMLYTTPMCEAGGLRVNKLVAWATNAKALQNKQIRKSQLKFESRGGPHKSRQARHAYGCIPNDTLQSVHQ
jgi:hypothetical protein